MPLAASIAWRLGIVIGLGWLVPDRVLLIVVGIVVVPFHLAQVGEPSRRAWAGTALAAVVAAVVLQALSNHVADAQLAALRAEIVDYRARTGTYPIGGEADLDRLGLSTAMGLAGVRRHATYGYMPSTPNRAPILFYAYAFPFGRRCIDVETGRSFVLD